MDALTINFGVFVSGKYGQDRSVLFIERRSAGAVHENPTKNINSLANLIRIWSFANESIIYLHYDKSFFLNNVIFI